jgi:ACS family sodium-dependent inorganic phosphate cotransporter
MVLMLVALLLCYVDRIIVSLAAIEMQKEFGWSDSEKGLVLSSFFIGYLIMQALGGLVSNRFGGRNIFFIAVVLWSVCTILLPMTAYLSFGLLIFARVMLGIGEGASFPSAYNLVHGWMPVRERSRSIGLMSAAGAVGTVATLLVAGKIIEAYGWPSVFYIFGSMGFIWAVFWLRMVPPTPVPPDDAEQRSSPEKKPPIPWKLLLTHPAVLTIYLASICAGGVSFTMASWLPSYFVDTFGVSLTEAGIYSILPWILVAVATVLAGLYQDRRIGAGEKVIKIRKRVTVFGFAVIAVSALTLVYAAHIWIAVAIVCVMFIGLGIAINGYSPTAAELLPDHGDVFYGFAAASGSLAAALIVSLVGILLDSTGSYDLLYLGISGFSVLTALVYMIFGRADSLYTTTENISHDKESTHA